MSANTKIEWADHTFNPWIGCAKVSPGCDNCYAKAEWDDRRHRAVWGPGQPRSRTKTWGDPEKWNKQAFFACKSCAWRGTFKNAQLGVLGFYSCPECGSDAIPTRARVFCSSLADVFDNEVDPQWRADLFELIEVTPNLDWLLLTKRIGNVQGMLTSTLLRMRDLESIRGQQWPWPNVWIGATIVNQEEADRDIPKLLQVPAAKRFLSMEPLLGPVDVSRYLGRRQVPNGDGYGGDHAPGWTSYPPVDWVIVGGESGPGARPMHPDWARSLRDQCQAAGVPFMFKQWGEWCPRGPESMGYPSVDGVPRFRMTDAGHNGQDLAADGGNDVWMNRVGKKAAGRLLDGCEWNGVPA